MRSRAAGFDRKGRLKFQCPERKIIPMTPQIAHGPVPKIPPAIPLRAGKIDGMKWPRGRRSQPEVPIKSCWHGFRFGWPLPRRDNVAMSLRIGFALPSPGARDPDMSSDDWPNRAALHQLNHAMIIFVGVNLDTHLRGDFGFGRGFTKF